MNTSPALRRSVVTAGFLLAAACSSDEESACSKLRERLEHIQTEEMDDDAPQSWDEVLRTQELQQERGEIRGEMTRRHCE